MYSSDLVLLIFGGFVDLVIFGGLLIFGSLVFAELFCCFVDCVCIMLGFAFRCYV